MIKPHMKQKRTREPCFLAVFCMPGPADAADTDYMFTVLHTAHKGHHSGSLGEMNEVSGLERVPALAHQQGPQAEVAGVPSTC